MERTMQTHYGFDFGQANSCILVGAGASAHLDYPSFSGEKDVRPIVERAAQRGNKGAKLDDAHLKRATNLMEHLGGRFQWNLERMYEHIAHVPPFLYEGDLNCNTDFLCEWLLEEVVGRLAKAPAPDQIEPTKEKWQRLLACTPKPVAVFTTNYDSVLEACLKGMPYADGFVDGWYSRDAFSAEQKAGLALVKLHGSADWLHVRQYDARAVVRSTVPVDESLRRPACLPPFRQKWPDEEPYSSGYQFLRRALRSARDFIVIGFSWRDISVAEVLHNALNDRTCRADLTIHVFDPSPYLVEERIRVLLHRRGASALLRGVQWYHHQTCFLDLDPGSSGQQRSLLTSSVSLADQSHWVDIAGERPMLKRQDSTVTISYESTTWYFESGRLVLLPQLPPEFQITVRMVMHKFCSGWDPGLTLEDELGDHVLLARFVPQGHPLWCRASDGEENVNGIRLASGLRKVARHPVSEGEEVVLHITSSRTSTVVGGRLGDRDLPNCVRRHEPDRRPVRLHLGAYPWYEDDGRTGSEAECRILACEVAPS
jgi:hypothetical protein